MAGEDQARRECHDHQHDKIALSRPIGAAIEDDRDGEYQQAQPEGGAGLDQAHSTQLLREPPIFHPVKSLPQQFGRYPATADALKALWGWGRP